MKKTIIAAMLLISTSAAAEQMDPHDVICLQYQKFTTLVKKQVDEGFPEQMHLQALQNNSRQDLIWMVKMVHRRDFINVTPKDAGFIAWQMCNADAYPGADK